MARNLSGKEVRIRPELLFLFPDGRLAHHPNPWHVDSVSATRREIGLHHGTGFSLTLEGDQVREYLSDPTKKTAGFLYVRGQFKFTGIRGVDYEPLTQFPFRAV